MHIEKSTVRLITCLIQLGLARSVSIGVASLNASQQGGGRCYSARHREHDPEQYKPDVERDGGSRDSRPADFEVEGAGKDDAYGDAYEGAGEAEDVLEVGDGEGEGEDEEEQHRPDAAADESAGARAHAQG